MMSGALLVAVTLAVVAVLAQRAADRPIGEGQLFLADARFAADKVTGDLTTGMGASDAIRHVRNDLTLEAVSVVNADGVISSSTSDTLVGVPVENGLLRFGHGDRRFVAVAAPVPAPIEVDGVVEWEAGEILYQALHPLDGGGSLLMSYDISELLIRRANARGVQSWTLQLLGVALFAAAVGVALGVGRARAARRYEQMELEAQYLRMRSADLEAHNAALDEALDLAEETNRVRAEFVLMINHELRTPLTGVVTGAELLASGVDMADGDRERLLEDMVTDGRRLQEMIAQMLAVARIENRGLNFELSTSGVSEVCERLVAAHPRLEHASHPPSADEPLVRTDTTVLGQIVGSLADNAMTHGAEQVTLVCTPELSFEPQHRVGEIPGDAIYWLVCDDGPGIEHDFLPRAFEKFEKRSWSAGTGLGLYLVTVMAEAIGAGLLVDTGPGGTTMAVAVPRVRQLARDRAVAG